MYPQNLHTANMPSTCRGGGDRGPGDSGLMFPKTLTRMLLPITMRRVSINYIVKKSFNTTCLKLTFKCKRCTLFHFYYKSFTTIRPEFSEAGRGLCALFKYTQK